MDAADSFAKVRCAFAALRGLRPGDREVRLADLRAEAPSIAEEVSELLAHHDASTGILNDHSPIGAAARSAALAAVHDLSASSESAGQTFGPYALIRPLGEGGFGSVWLARQEMPVRRDVALKIIKAGMDTRAVLRRFDAERMVLAAMEHPGIARIFDAGETPAGRPYFVMEFVRGDPLNRYCDHCRMSIRDRLQLFIGVCLSVQHAHQKGVIHRDLKPSNILVEEIDGRHCPKIIDFGIAKVGSTAGPGGTLTAEGQPIGTPEYMSPEQLDGGFDVDTRADVYSLGIILYELMVGVLPFDSAQLRGGGYDQMRRIIREQEALRPGTRFLAAKELQDQAAGNRGLDRTALIRKIRGDIEWIILKAIEKDRERRYATASDLAAEIRRHLTDNPVLAGPPSFWYRARKFITRNRAGVTAAAAAALALSVGLAVAAVGFVRAGQERDRAVLEAAKAEAINEFLLQRMLAATDPNNFGRDVKVIDVLDVAAKQRSSAFKDQPEVLAAVEFTLGQTYSSLGLHDRAAELLASALAAQRVQFGPLHPTTTRTLAQLTTTHVLGGRIATAEELVRSLGHVETGAPGIDRASARDIDRARATLLLSQGKHAEALDINKNVLESTRQEFGDDHPKTLEVQSSLLSVQLDAGEIDEADVLSLQLADKLAKAHGADHPLTIRILMVRADLLAMKGDMKSSEAVARDAVDRALRTWGEDHLMLAVPLSHLGNALKEQGRHEEARKLYRQALTILERSVGMDHHWALTVTGNLANSLNQTGQVDEAERLFRENLEIRRRVLGPDHPDVAVAMDGLALTLARQSEWVEAIGLEREALRIGAASLGPEHPQVLTILANLSSFLSEAGEHAEAAIHARQMVEIEERVLGPTHQYVAMDYRGLARALRGAGNLAEAEAAARRAHSIARDHHPGELHLRHQCTSMLAEVLIAAGSPGPARELLEALHAALAADESMREQARLLAADLAELCAKLCDDDRADHWSRLAQLRPEAAER